MPEQLDESSITVHIEAEIELTPAQVWPDGDKPAVVDAAAVKAVMELTAKRECLKNWLLDDPLDVDVTVVAANPDYSGEESLPGIEPPVQWITTTERVWP